MLAVSHELQSEPQTSYTAVLPNPARNLSILAVQVNRLIIGSKNIGHKLCLFTGRHHLTPVASPCQFSPHRVQHQIQASGESKLKEFHHLKYFWYLAPQDEDQDGDLSRPWSEVMVVPENLTTYVLKDLPPGQINLGPDQ